MQVLPLVAGTAAVGYFISKLRRKPPPSVEVDGGGAWVLSIQSSVVHGYVGNKAAVFPLQTLGFEVDPVSSCQFSNHTGYPSFTGYRHSGQELQEIRRGLTENDFLRKYSAMLTGYCASASFLQEVQQLAKVLRAENPSVFYLCDPVLGDDGKMYVPQEFIQIYKSILPLASCITPNQTEAELLSGVTLKTVADTHKALQWFHQQGVKIVMITSCVLSRGLAGNQALTAPPSAEFIDIVASLHAPEEEQQQQRVFHLCVPRAMQGFTGTGDLTSALLLGWLHMLTGGKPHTNTTPAALCDALERTVATMQAVVRATMERKSLELALIQSRDSFRNAPVIFRAVPFPSM